MRTCWAVVLLLAPIFGQTVNQPNYEYQDQQWGEGEVVEKGPWVVVGDTNNPWGAQQPPPQRNNPFGIGINAGLGFDTRPLLTYGLGAVILMLIVSTALSIGKKFWPVLSRFIPEEELDAGRSLEQMSSLAQYAFEAFEKYQALNDKKD